MTLSSTQNREILRDIDKILIIRTDGIGDLLNSTPAIALLRENYPSVEITVLARPLNAPVLIGNPDVDKDFSLTDGGEHENCPGAVHFIRIYAAVKRSFDSRIAMHDRVHWPIYLRFFQGGIPIA